MTDLGLQHSALSHASSRIDQIFHELSTAGETLDDRAHAYLGSGWQGQSAEAYRAGYQEWTAGRREVFAALARMGVLIDEANQRFTTTDQGVDGSMQGLHARLGGVGYGSGSGAGA